MKKEEEEEKENKRKKERGSRRSFQAVVRTNWSWCCQRWPNCLFTSIPFYSSRCSFYLSCSMCLVWFVCRFRWTADRRRHTDKAPTLLSRSTFRDRPFWFSLSPSLLHPQSLFWKINITIGNLERQEIRKTSRRLGWLLCIELRRSSHAGRNLG